MGRQDDLTKAARNPPVVNEIKRVANRWPLAKRQVQSAVQRRETIDNQTIMSLGIGDFHCQHAIGSLEICSADVKRARQRAVIYDVRLNHADSFDAASGPYHEFPISGYFT